MNPELIAIALQLGANIIALIRHKDGTLTLMPLLDAADASFTANLKQMSDWAAAHPQAPATPAS